jgi:ABC-type nickel/cobalt efflux system permease component RcnA
MRKVKDNREHCRFNLIEKRSEGVTMPEAHEQIEHAEHAEHAAVLNRKIALLIAVFALFLALSETLGKSANTDAITLNIKASDTWNFFQAKTIRRTVVVTAAESLKAAPPVPSVTLAGTNGATGTTAAADPPTPSTAIERQVAEWEKTAARYRSEPETREGTTELAERAQEAEHERDTALARYHHYEIASAAFQIGIVLCSAAVITGMTMLAWLAGGIGIIGIAFMAIGLFVPQAVHLI